MTRWWRSIWCAGEGEEVNGFLNGFLAGDAAHSDAIDLTGFDAASTVFTEKSVNGNLVVRATDGDKVATPTFDRVDGALNFASNGDGGIVITNSPAAVGPDNGTVDSVVTNARPVSTKFRSASEISE